MSSPASFSSGSGAGSPRGGARCSSGGLNSRAVAVVTNRWFREQRRADQDATRMLTLLKQRKISCILKVESIQRGVGGDTAAAGAAAPDTAAVERELGEIERQMAELEKDREDRSRRIMDRRVLQVTTLQELGLLEAAGKEARWRSESDLKEAPGDGERGPPSPAASSSSSHASRRPTPPPLAGPGAGAGLRAGSDPSLARPDPSGRLQPAPAPPTGQGHHGRGLAAKLSPRLGRRNPLRMLSNAIDFRTRRKQRPKSADFENTEEPHGEARSQEPAAAAPGAGGGARSASVTDILECVSLSPGPQQKPGPEAGGRVLEGRNSAPDMLTDPAAAATLNTRAAGRARTRLSAAAAAKQKLSTRFQPQRKAQHRGEARLLPRPPSSASSSSSVKRAQTFSLGGGGPGGGGQPGYKTLPKQASSRSIGSTDSSQSTASSRKSSNSSNTSDCSLASAAGAEISQSALEEIAAFEKFITEYFENSDNNNTAAAARKASHPPAGRARQKVSASSVLSEVLELSI